MWVDHTETCCEDSCGREAFVFRPSPDELGPSPTDVYDACFEFYGYDRIVPDVDSWDLAQNLVRLGLPQFYA